MMVSVNVIEQADALAPDFLLVQQRIINSHPAFNSALSGVSSLSSMTIKHETQDVLAMGGQYFKIMHGVVCVGFGHWLASNPYDKHPWIGLLVIERSFTGSGIGKAAVQQVNDHLSSLNVKPVRLFVQVSNPQAFSFWTHNGFHSIEMTTDEHGREAHILQQTE